MKTILKIILLISVITVFTVKTNYAQETENEAQYRGYLDIKLDLLDDVKFSFEPELRFDDNFSLDEYLLEGEIEYKALKFLSFSASYGYMRNIRKEKDNETINRYSLSSTFEKDFDRFEASFRLQYSNYADDDVSINDNYLRYKLEIEYDIIDCKITPTIAVQPFQNLNNSELHKIRYMAGFDYKLFKKNFLEVRYKLDYFYTEYRNRHIISLGYKYKF